MTLGIAHVCIGAQDPDTLAGFWAAALHAPDAERYLHGSISGLLLRPPTGPTLFLNSGTPPARDLGLALRSPDSPLKAEVTRLLELGAVIVDDRPRGPIARHGLGRVVMADPEGNTFSVSSSEKETADVIEALDAGRDVDTSNSYFANTYDPATVTFATASAEIHD
jgi:catechol 2,3-dioxygenase-like lactoylglutathione lyase family enzyme